MNTNVRIDSSGFDATAVSSVTEEAITKAVLNFGRRSKVFFKFESFPLRDELGSVTMQNVGSDTPLIVNGAYGNAFQLRPATTLSFPFALKDKKQLSIGFWWTPVNMKPGINPNTGLNAYFRTPVISKASFAFDLGSGLVSAQDSTFVIYEESREDNQNVMHILLESITGDQVVLESEAYEAGLNHYFWFTFNGAASQAKLFIDGKEVELEIIEGTSLPLTLNQTNSTQVEINNSAVGQNGLLRNTYAVIDELYMEDKYIADSFKIARHINFGSEYELDAQLRNRDRVYTGFAFDDPTAINITAVYSNGTNIYAGRTDGRVFKGDRLLWRSRKDFANRDELNYVQTKFLSTESSVSIDDGALRVSKSNVRI